MSDIIGSGLEGYLHREARERAMNRIADAEEKAQQIVDEAREEAERIRERIEEQTQGQIDERRRQILARARVEAKQAQIRRREAVLQKVWQEAETELRALSSAEERLGMLRQLIEDAASQLSGGDLELQVKQDDRELFDGQTLEDLREDLQTYEIAGVALASEPAPIWGGVVVRRRDTNEIVDNSFGERLALTERLLRNRVYEFLTPQGVDSSAGQE